MSKVLRRCGQEGSVAREVGMRGGPELLRRCEAMAALGASAWRFRALVDSGRLPRVVLPGAVYGRFRRTDVARLAEEAGNGR